MSDEWKKEHERLWDTLVPDRGQAETIQGEIIRCIGKLTDEAYRNGNINWDAGHERMLSYIAVVLLSDDTFPDERKARIRRDIEEIRSERENPNVGGDGTCYYTLSEAVVDWCLKHPDVIARPKDPDLHR